MRKIFSLSSLVLGILFFIIFIVAACAAYYLTAGVFVTSQLAVLYTALGLMGALAVVFRGYIFATLFYIGCALGWATGHYISSLEGEFAPTAGVIATFFLIGCFGLVGLLLEISRMRRRRRKKAEKKETERQAEEERQKALLAEQEARTREEAEAKAREEAAKEPEDASQSAAEEMEIP